MIDPGALRYDAAGLVPGVVQDAVTGGVLMLGWLDREAVELTLETGRVHFWSRSRERIWMKGEESGNVLEVVTISADCDADTLLIRALPAGPTCHTGKVSCFDEAENTRPEGFAWLEELWSVIDDRRSSPTAVSYTSSLLAGGVDAAGRKVAEEATEVLMAAKDHANGITGPALAEESADLVFHLLVLLAERGVAPGDVIRVLRDRTG